MTPMQHTPSYAAMPKRRRSARKCHGSPLVSYTRAGNFRDQPTGTEQNATLDVMDHQGAGRSRSAADMRRQPPWPPLEGPDDTGAQRVLGPGSGAQPVLGSGSGAQPVLGSGSGA